MMTSGRSCFSPDRNKAHLHATTMLNKRATLFRFKQTTKQTNKTNCLIFLYGGYLTNSVTLSTLEFGVSFSSAS